MLAPYRNTEHPNMSVHPKAKPFHRSRIAWVTGILCAACCAVPFAGFAFGSATIAAFAGYFEEAALAVVVLGVALLVYKLASRKKAPVCDLNCGCHPITKNGSGSKAN